MLLAVVSILMGALMGGYGVYGAHADRQLIDGGTVAVGTVLSSRERPAGRIRETIASVSFSAQSRYGPSPQRLDHVVRKGWPVARRNAPAIHSGEPVNVFYNPDDPSDAVIEGWEHRYGSWWTAGALFFGGGGVASAAKARSDAAVRRRARRIQASW
ncbi:DUF3592 domain-containing protein [Arthrobacter zhaoxinii]|uniref:DUF3592 domain-containing protein n=1 Tax=Arthrobacter zhaoxinii TaxID=2964616 RepID=UPI002107F019|nr:DUF3592 domain-containing protein [Arthrobacter zhaoxinii]MCQ1999937.1 DUF3592 domain-containing protein [Arthrobacter zhaoxinii]